MNRHDRGTTQARCSTDPFAHGEWNGPELITSALLEWQIVPKQNTSRKAHAGTFHFWSHLIAG